MNLYLEIIGQTYIASVTDEREVVALARKLPNGYAQVNPRKLTAAEHALIDSLLDDAIAAHDEDRAWPGVSYY